ncbi:MAG: hypothetical protein AAFQ07_02465 [Chloroflexota bacterium]
MNSTEVAIMRTILYADVFSFPLTLDELHRYLISDYPSSKQTLSETLQKSSYLKRHLHQAGGYMCLQTRIELIARRQARERLSVAMWDDAMKYGRWLSIVPFVRMVALTGALAMRNPASADDDFDYMLVTTPGRVWMARGFAVLLVRFVRLFGRELCPNYVLAEDALLQQQQDLYMAHEVTQMRLIQGASLYAEMLRINQWSQAYLPNALALDSPEDKRHIIQRLFERLLGGRLGDWLEQWEYERKTKKFSTQIHTPQSSAEIDVHTVKGHFEDHGQPVMVAYRERLTQYGLRPFGQSSARAGD